MHAVYYFWQYVKAGKKQYVLCYNILHILCICLVSHFGNDPGHTYSITSNLTSTTVR